MSSQTVRSGVGRTTIPDYLSLAANIVYGAAGLLFLLGVYFDWQRPGKAIFENLTGFGLFTIADEPHANSGLFFVAIIVLIVGYGFSRSADIIEEWQSEDVDQTQEWTVDLGDE
jgi:hypothetical protein